MAKTKIFRNVTETFPTIFKKIIFHKISPKPFPQSFLLIFKVSENCPQTHREVPKRIIVYEFYQIHFQSLQLSEVFREF